MADYETKIDVTPPKFTHAAGAREGGRTHILGNQSAFALLCLSGTGWRAAGAPRVMVATHPDPPTSVGAEASRTRGRS